MFINLETEKELLKKTPTFKMLMNKNFVIRIANKPKSEVIDDLLTYGAVVIGINENGGDPTTISIEDAISSFTQDDPSTVTATLQNGAQLTLENVGTVAGNSVNDLVDHLANQNLANVELS